MENKFERERKVLLSLFEQSGKEYWKTLDEIAMETKINAATVAEILATSGDFVRSSYRVKQGEPLYTSRELFRSKAPLVDKVIGAFKNRID